MCLVLVLALIKYCLNHNLGNSILYFISSSSYPWPEHEIKHLGCNLRVTSTTWSFDWRPFVRKKNMMEYTLHWCSWTKIFCRQFLTIHLLLEVFLKSWLRWKSWSIHKKANHHLLEACDQTSIKRYENIRSVWSDEHTVAFFKWLHETNRNLIFQIYFPHGLRWRHLLAASSAVVQWHWTGELSAPSVYSECGSE